MDNIATMNSSELAAHIEVVKAGHSVRLASLRALLKARKAEEALGLTVNEPDDGAGDEADE